MKIETLYEKFIASTGISTDTRTIKKGMLYFALKGSNFNGNNFVKQAFTNGAKYCIVDEEEAVINTNCLLVNNVLNSLQQLATYHKNTINIPIIALTGSNGKTTTKELIHQVLASTYKVNATKGNLNNHIGVPLTLLSFTKDLDYGIVEMGANHQKEIAFLCQIAQPNYGLITNFGKAHLEGFGGVEGVIKGKSEIYTYLKQHNKTIFINTDDATQLQQIESYKNIYTYGSDTKNQCVVRFLEANPFVKVNYQNLNINSQLIGKYNYRNIATAIAIGQHFKVTPQAIKKAIEAYKPQNNRSEIIEKKGLKIILDAYNANPTSMLAALENFKQLNAKAKYVFLGDMFELGNDAKKEHQAIAIFAETHFENIILIGENFYKTQTKKANKYNTFESLKSDFNNFSIHNEAAILIKGSRGMALERLLELL